MSSCDTPSWICGFIDDIRFQPSRGWLVTGWAFDPTTPDRRVIVAALCSGREVARAEASIARADLLRPGVDDGRRGFELLAPLDEVHAHNPAALDVVALPERTPLPRAAVATAAPRHEIRLRASVDVVGRTRIAGWLRDEAQPDQRLNVAILLDDVVLRSAVANALRTDLRDTGLGDGRYGFDFVLSPPLPSDADHAITILCEETGQPLPGSPFHFPASHRFNETFRQHVAQTLAGLSAPNVRADALTFLIGQVEKLRQEQARADAREAESVAHERARRLGADAEETPPRILFIDDRAPDMRRDAGSCAILSHMQAAQALGHEVSFIASAIEPDATTRHTLEEGGFRCWAAPTYPMVESLLRGQAGAFNAIYLHRLSNASRYLALARHYMPGARIISSVADLAHLRLERQAVVEGRPELRTAAGQERVREHMAAWASHAVITHSRVEADILARAVPTANVYVVPWLTRLPPEPMPFHERRSVAFVAHYGHAPNLDAAKWLVEDILPLIREAAPEIELLLVGSAMPDAIVRMDEAPGVRVLGHVAELPTLLRSVRLTVAPLRFGAGIKGKVLESWAAGLPCVATPIALEGLPLPAPLESCLARTAREFADAVVRLYHDAELSAEIGAVARATIAQQFNAEIVEHALQRVLERS
ncbi:glycosyltransferase family 4 protein [Acetobacter sp. DsW_063]|uniref:glycosyltransferase family 4 protein n=1 Tax=Acetobacter sp. DsW_063 TaxID=1514894 RepID=UPI001302DC07|nr:glycosyltransferase [Acetobacter sp. DsW_063]